MFSNRKQLRYTRIGRQGLTSFENAVYGEQSKEADMGKLFTPHEIDDLKQQVEKLESSSQQEELAVDMLLALSMRLRGTFPTPATAIKFFLKRWELTETYLAKVLGSRSRASEILSGKRNLSISDLRTLRDNLGIPAELLLGDPKAAEDQGIDFSRYPVAEMAKLGLVRSRLTKRSRGVEDAIREFFSSAGFSPEQARQACYRRSVRKNEKSDACALQVWLAAVRKLAFAMDVSGYTPVTREDLTNIARMSIHSDGPVRAVEALRAKGIRVIAMPHLRGTYLDGAVFLLDAKPVIGLTLRYDRLDNFWHTLMHELSHLALGHVSEEPVFDDLEIAVQDGKECEADLFAQNIFIPHERWKAFREQRISTMSICALAAELSLSPAIVAGRYRFETKNYRIFTALVGHGEVRRLFSSFTGE